MQRGNLGLYNFFQLGELQRIVDYTNEKYTEVSWKQYGTWAPKQNSGMWSISVRDISIPSRPDMLAPQATKRVKGLPPMSVRYGNIPIMGHAVQIAETDMREILEMADLTNQVFADELTARMVNSLDILTAGFHMQLNSWVYEALTTDKIEVTQEMDLGIPFRVDFGGKEKLQLETTQPWFNADGTANANATVIKDLQRMRKVADDNLVRYDHFEVAKSTLDKILVHPNVVEAVSNRMTNGLSTNMILSEREVLGALSTGFDIPPIIAVDEKSVADRNGYIEDLPASFDLDTIVLINSGANLFSVKNSITNIELDNNPNTLKTSAEDGRINYLHMYGSEPYGFKTSGELKAMPILTNPDQVVRMKKLTASGVEAAMLNAPAPTSAKTTKPTSK